MNARSLIATHLAFLCATPSFAATERIDDFLSAVELRPDGAVDVTETIRFFVTGAEIRHGINRDIPTDYRTPRGFRSTTDFTLEDVELDGRPEPYELQRLENGVRVRIGEPGKIVSHGEHAYSIRYLTDWQVAFGSEADRFAWNVTGSGWTFPIERAELRLGGPRGAEWGDVRLFTGPPGSRGNKAALVAAGPGFLDVATTRPLPRGSGFTVEASLPKGLVSPPSQLQALWRGLIDNLAVAIGLVGLIAAALYDRRLFRSVGARPAAAIVPQFGPPRDFTPAMVAYLDQKAMSDRAFSAAVIGLAVARRLRLVHDPDYRLLQQTGEPWAPGREGLFETALFAAGDELIISAAARERIVGARTVLKGVLGAAMKPSLLVTNVLNALPAVGIALVAIGAALVWLLSVFGGSDFAAQTAMIVGFSVIGALLVMLAWLNGGRGRFVLGLVGVVFLLAGIGFAYSVGPWLAIAAFFLAATGAMAAASFRRLTARTAEGWKRQDDIDGLKMFMVAAEADRLKILNPPDFTPALYEKLLPYAVALGVEMAWSARFAAALAESQTDYKPDWYDSDAPWSASDSREFASAVGSGFSEAVAPAATPPSSGGDSSGGGSGVGGGGGGGSGW